MCVRRLNGSTEKPYLAKMPIRLDIGFPAFKVPIMNDGPNANKQRFEQR